MAPRLTGKERERETSHCGGLRAQRLEGSVCKIEVVPLPKLDAGEAAARYVSARIRAVGYVDGSTGMGEANVVT